jgi:hypothetical protein
MKTEEVEEEGGGGGDGRGRKIKGNKMFAIRLWTQKR